MARHGDYRVTLRVLEDDRVLYIGRIAHLPPPMANRNDSGRPVCLQYCELPPL